MRTKEEVMREAHLDELPDDEFMALLEKIEGRQAGGSTENPVAVAAEYTPQQIGEELNAALVARSLGGLIAQARAEAGVTLDAVGQQIGVSKARVNQLEHSENLEVATLVRLAGALGYRVGISLEPKEAGRKPLRVELGGRGPGGG